MNVAGESSATGRQVSFRWNLRQVMAARGIFKTSDLVAPLHERGIEISRQMVHRIVTGTPQRINVDLLAALCDILDCTPDDLLELRIEHERAPRHATAGKAGIGDLRPVRAVVRRPAGL
ncbi:MAG: helix-turn-helix transcriptional regulator [Micrococcales bacterium]|nr:helix-turn-helix transcriptional regulator [Micrococcales bacterium]